MYSLSLHTHRSRARLASWSLVALVLASCDAPTGAPREEVPAPAPASIQIVSGDSQSGVVGTDLALPLVAKLLDATGRGVRDQAVTFAVIGGGGVVTPSLITSDQEGVVRARWTLGTSTAVAGLVEARVGSDNGGSGPAVRFRAAALSGPVTTVRKLAGDAQRTEVGSSLADSLAVRVVDRFDNGVGNAAVQWTVVSGGGTVSPATSTTDATGLARTRWAPSAAGRDTARAEVTAIAPVTFTATVTVPLVFASVSAGHDHTCGITADRAAYCWGNNSYGQLGDGSTSGSATPVAVAGGVGFAALSAGVFHTCGLTTGGSAYCWGGDYGPTPVSVGAGLTFTSLSVGGWGFFCGLTPGGAAYCWGENSYGELGDGTTTSSSTPVPVTGGITFQSLSAALATTCGVATDGTAYCWGYGAAYGDPRCELDEATNTPFCTSPVAVPGGIAFANVGSGDGFFCGLTALRAAYCWGMYPEGRWSTAPVLVPDGHTFGALSVDAQRACGVAAGGSAYCWGWIPISLYQGQFSTAPTAVPGGLSFAAVSVGWFHTCGVTPGGTAYCWGGNADGELGDGSHTSSLVPVKVAGVP